MHIVKIFRAAAAEISNLINCPDDIVREFAILATSRDAFGDPSEWTAIQVLFNIIIITLKTFL